MTNIKTPNFNYSFKSAHTEIDVGRILAEAPEAAAVVVLKIHGKETVFIDVEKVMPAYKHAGIQAPPACTEGYINWFVHEDGSVSGSMKQWGTAAPVRWQIARHDLSAILDVWGKWKKAQAKSRVTVALYQ
jgi:hypothetical protein